VYPRRVTILAAIFVALIAAVALQLVRLQVVQGHVYAQLAKEGRVWDELRAVPRGRILDRNGSILACDEASYGLAVVARDFPLQKVHLADITEMLNAKGEDRSALRQILRERLANSEAAVAALAALSGMEQSKLAEGILPALERAVRYGGLRSPEPFIFGIAQENWLRLEVLLNPPVGERRQKAASRDVPVPGVRCVTQATRAYPAGATAGHVLGYLSEYDREEVERLRQWGRLTIGGETVMQQLKDACERSEVAEAVGRSLGRSPDTICSAEELMELIEEMPPKDRDQLYSALGPPSVAIERWMDRGKIVALTEGEQVWIRSRGHLEDRRIGRTGIEQSWNDELRGKHGYKVVIRNLAIRDGEAAPELDYLKAERPVPGTDLTLELDAHLQKIADAALAATGRPGAVVMLEPGTGAVMVLVSRPTYDPAVFVSGDSVGVRAALRDPSRPLVGRAFSGVYPPGSVFKALVALAGLEEGILTRDTVFDCAHTYEVGDHTFRCMAIPGHGTIDLRRALSESCNIYFYQVAERIGAEQLLRWAHALGFGAKTGLDVPGEVSGSVPGPETADELPRRTLVQLGIGQGPLSVTPMQVAQLFAAIANDGPCYMPRIVHTPRMASSARRLSPATRAALLEGLIGTVHDVRGTAHSAFFTALPGRDKAFVELFPGIRIVSKTGTAETGRGEPHSWFAGFAPADDPAMAFAVLVEGGGHGGHVAAPVAARVLAEFFRLRANRKMEE
jgi:cell division protein FtsI/penicillin-binding protein 2